MQEGNDIVVVADQPADKGADKGHQQHQDKGSDQHKDKDSSPQKDKGQPTNTSVKSNNEVKSTEAKSSGANDIRAATAVEAGGKVEVGADKKVKVREAVGVKKSGESANITSTNIAQEEVKDKSKADQKVDPPPPTHTPPPTQPPIDTPAPAPPTTLPPVDSVASLQSNNNNIDPMSVKSGSSYGSSLGKEVSIRLLKHASEDVLDHLQVNQRSRRLSE